VVDGATGNKGEHMMDLMVTDADWDRTCDCGRKIAKGELYLHDCSPCNAGMLRQVDWCKHCAEVVIQRAESQLPDYNGMRKALRIVKWKRDHSHPCDAYESIGPEGSPYVHNDCESDGHYLCRQQPGCRWYKKPKE
jgi:hypothetical protein